ncbi:MAG TPA: hypothetical protein DEP04_04125 [Dehalococcoidia bacterium]|nr:hypothetical protein [Chloroflexota bacterium]HCE75794.1 hypothetical protein [Dehalococcoidia bacterium]
MRNDLHTENIQMLVVERNHKRLYQKEKLSIIIIWKRIFIPMYRPCLKLKRPTLPQLFPLNLNRLQSQHIPL